MNWLCKGHNFHHHGHADHNRRRRVLSQQSKNSEIVISAAVLPCLSPGSESVVIHRRRACCPFLRPDGKRRGSPDNRQPAGTDPGNSRAHPRGACSGFRWHDFLRRYFVCRISWPFRFSGRRRQSSGARHTRQAVHSCRSHGISRTRPRNHDTRRKDQQSVLWYLFQHLVLLHHQQLYLFFQRALTEALSDAKIHCL